VTVRADGSKVQQQIFLFVGDKSKETMSTFHKPRVFRSLSGCCICKAKSSSSRFTDSAKYEDQFRLCFQLQESREGEICNACVLLVKRWKKLPKGTKRNWAHVVDARVGPGIKTSGKLKKRQEESGVEQFKKIKKKQFKKIQKITNNIDDEFVKTEATEEVNGNQGDRARNRLRNNNLADFFDNNYWKREETCCGSIMRGQFGEVAIDNRNFSVCSNIVHRKIDTINDLNSSAKPFTVESLIESELRKFTETESVKNTTKPRVKDPAIVKEKNDHENDEGFCDKASTTTGPSSPDSCKLVLEED